MHFLLYFVNDPEDISHKMMTHEMRIRKQRAGDAGSGVTSRTKDNDRLLRHSVLCES